MQVVQRGDDQATRRHKRRGVHRAARDLAANQLRRNFLSRTINLIHQRGDVCADKVSGCQYNQTRVIAIRLINAAMHQIGDRRVQPHKISIRTADSDVAGDDLLG